MRNSAMIVFGVVVALIIAYLSGYKQRDFLQKTKDQAKSQKTTSSLGLAVPVNDGMDLKGSGTKQFGNYFGHKFPTSEKKVAQDQFWTGAPYRVLEVLFTNSQGTAGVANVEDFLGNTFLTMHPRVIVMIKEGEFFQFPADKKTGRRQDEPVRIDGWEIEKFTNRYLEDNASP